MKKSLIPVIFSILFQVPHYSFSQNAKIEKLLSLVQTGKADTARLPLLNKLSWEYAKTGSYDKALFYAHASLDLGKVILRADSDVQTQLSTSRNKATSYSTIGIININQGNYEEALKNHFIALRIRQVIHDQHGLAASYNNIGLVSKELGNYPEALKNYFASLKIREDIGDKHGLAECYTNIGNIYFDQSNYQEALNSYLADLKIRKEIGDSVGIGGSYNNLANVYNYEGDSEEALKNYLVCLKIAEANDDQAGMATAHDNVGSIYSAKGNYEEALKNHFISLHLEEEMGDKANISATCLNIGGVYMKQKKYAEAEGYMLRAKKLADEIGNKRWLKTTYNYLASLDSAKGDFKGAYLNHRKFDLYSDLLDNEQSQRKSVETRMKFEFEKKEAVTKAEQDKKDSIAAADQKREQLFLWFLLALAMAVTIIAAIIYRGLRQSKKAKKVIELQRDEITSQKHIVENQKNLVEEKQKEIVDSITYAKRIQHTLLANKQLLDAHLKEHFILFKPKDIVSGDFYWATQRGSRFYLAVCDCTGHGVPGAFMSLLNISFLNEAVNEKNLVLPNEILDHVRRRLIETMDGGQDGMDAILMCFESTKNGTSISYSSANNSPAIIRNGALIATGADKMPVGKGEKTDPFTLRIVEAQKGDNLYLYSDGFADQFGGEKGKKFKSKQLTSLIASISSLPASEQALILNQTFEDWKGNHEQVDDMLVIGIRIQQVSL